MLLKKLDEVFNLYNKKKQIKINDDINLLISILDKNIEYTVTHNGDAITNKELGFGEVLKYFILEHNDLLLKKGKGKTIK